MPALLILFFISRMLLITPSPIFFDAPEYLTRFQNPNYLSAIASGHIPYHSGYIALLWPFYHAAQSIRIDPVSMILIIQVLLSMLAIACFYNSVRFIANERVARIAAVLAALIPLYWITNVTVMMEATYINLFLISLYLLLRYEKTGKLLLLVLGFVAWTLSFLTHQGIILWIPFTVWMLYLVSKKRALTAVLSVFAATVIAMAANSALISYGEKIPLAQGILTYLIGKSGEHVSLPFTLRSLAVILRNTLLPSLQNNTIGMVFVALVSLYTLARKQSKLFILGLLWIVPAVIADQWWDSLLFGRHAALAGFGFAFLAAVFLEKRKIATTALIVYMAAVTLPALWLLKTPSPYFRERRVVSQLPAGLFIDTHFARPQIQGVYRGETVFINEPGWSKTELKHKIDSLLIKGGNVYITSQALSDPYGLYSGPYVHSLSLSYTKPPELSDLITNYRLVLNAVVDSNAGISIYRIVDKAPSPYPSIRKLTYSSRRLNAYDPFALALRLITTRTGLPDIGL